MNGTALKGLAKAEITNPTKSFEELVERAVKMERKQTKKRSDKTDSLDSSGSDTTSNSDEEPVIKGRDWQQG